MLWPGCAVRWWSRREPPAPQPPSTSISDADGLPVLRFEELVERTATSGELNTIRRRCGFTVEFYEAEIAPMLRAFGAHVQLLPAVGSDEPGSLWTEALERASRALLLRQSRILPPGASPEDVGAAAHRWTAAVLWAALFEGMDEALLGRQVFAVAWTGVVRRWEPVGANLQEIGTITYRVGGAITRSGDESPLLAILLLGRWGSERFLGWLSEDRELWVLLCGRLAGSSQGGVLGELIEASPHATETPSKAAASESGPHAPVTVSPLPNASPDVFDAPNEEFLEEFEERQRSTRTGRRSGRHTS